MVYEIFMWMMLEYPMILVVDADILDMEFVFSKQINLEPILSHIENVISRNFLFYQKKYHALCL